MRKRNQKGMVLLVSLVLLLLLTLIAISASSQSTLQLRISSNSEQRNMAFQAAEAGLSSWTSAYLANEPTPPATGNVGQTKFEVTVVKAGLCTGTGFTPGSPKMECFDLASEGKSVCEGSTCAVATTHRQGGKRRGEIIQ